MKKKTYGIIVIIVLVLVIAMALILGAFDKRGEDVNLSLEDFKFNGEYQYGELDWGLSLGQLERKIAYSVQEDTTKEPVNEDYKNYISENLFLLDGESTAGKFEFYKGGLNMVSFSFKLENNYMEWFESKVAELTELYGLETDKMENSTAVYTTMGYKWNTDNSTLQIILGTDGGQSATVQIGVSARQQK